MTMFATQSAMSLKSLVKIAVSPHRASLPPAETEKPLIVLGNGPSLADDIEKRGDYLASATTMTVNFAANSPEFQSLNTNYHILADPHFFKSGDPNVDRLWRNLNKVRTPVTLLVPSGSNLAGLIDNAFISIARFPMTGASGGFLRLMHALYNSRLAMPRPRNVLIPALMCGIWLGFKEIYILGADHSWTRTLSVDDNNRVISIQPHFYREDGNEENRVAAVYANIKIHSILESFSIAFAAYHDIARYADANGVAIYNSTPGSFIDAFQRRPLPEL